MKNMSLKDLVHEELHFEYKKATGGFPKSFWETYSAFANSDGGYVFFGIEEDSKKGYSLSGLTLQDVIGLKSLLFNQVNNKEKVNINLLTDEDVDEIEIDGSYVLRITIKRCPPELKPVYINYNVYRGTFRRNADGDYHCSVEEVNSMIRDSSKKSLDLEILKDHDINSLDKESIRSYKNIFASLHPAHPFLKEDDNRFLEFIGAARLDNQGIYHPTKAGLLMFGYSYRIVYEFSNYFLDYIEKSSNKNERWDNRIQSDSGEWNGNVFTFFHNVTNALSKFLNKPFEMEGIYRNDDSLLHKSLREALCNALCNADYYLPGGVIVKKIDNCINFINPGCLMMDVEQMLRGGTSNPRNKTLLKMFNLIGIGERSGSGIPLIFLAAKEKNLPQPSINEKYNPDKTVLSIFIEKDLNENLNQLNNLEKQIINYLKINGPVSAKQISERLSKNITTIKLTLYGLIDKNMIKTSGTIKDKKYYL